MMNIWFSQDILHNRSLAILSISDRNSWLPGYKPKWQAMVGSDREWASRTVYEQCVSITHWFQVFSCEFEISADMFLTLPKLSMHFEHKIVISEEFRVKNDQGIKELTRSDITPSLYIIISSNQLSVIWSARNFQGKFSLYLFSKCFAASEKQFFHKTSAI